MRLKLFFDAVKDTDGTPITKSAIDAIPVAEATSGIVSILLIHSLAAVFGDVLQGLKKGEIVNHHIASLFRKQVLNTLNDFDGPRHKEP